MSRVGRLSYRSRHAVYRLMLEAVANEGLGGSYMDIYYGARVGNAQCKKYIVNLTELGLMQEDTNNGKRYHITDKGKYTLDILEKMVHVFGEHG